MSPFDFEITHLKVFGLVFVRMTALFVVAPFFGSRTIPAAIKVSLALVLSLILTPLIPVPEAPFPEDAVGYALLGVGEVAVGLIMGFMMFLVFMATQVGGQVIDLQMGFGLQNILNPAFETQFPLVGFLYYLMAILIFLGLEGHHKILMFLVTSFRRVPITTFNLDSMVLTRVVEAFAALFSTGVRIAAPALAALILTSVAMGILARLVPQINFLNVGFSVRIAAGLVMIYFSLGMFGLLVRGALDGMWRDVAFMLRHM